MKYNEQIRIVIVSYIVGILINLVLQRITGSFPGLEALISSIKVVSVLTLWWLFYFKLGWKIPLLNKILYRVNLNGTWFGTYKSLNMSQERFEGEISLRINQDFLTISIISFTEKYQNYSYSEELKYDEKSDTYGIVYVYSQKESNIFDCSQRNGTSEMELKKVDECLFLEGVFWTIHGTHGQINVKRISEKCIDTFAQAKNLHHKL